MEDHEPDNRLLEQVRASDREAFKVLFERYQPTVFRQTLFLTREPDLAHDLVQEAFLKVWEHRSSIQPHLPFLPYILKISRNLALDVFKHRATRERLEEGIPAPALSEGDDPEAAWHLGNLQKELAEIINQELPERCRTVFLLSRFEGKSHREIAGMLGLSVRTVENQINKALKIVRRSLMAKGFEGLERE